MQRLLSAYCHLEVSFPWAETGTSLPCTRTASKKQTRVSGLRLTGWLGKTACTYQRPFSWVSFDSRTVGAVSEIQKSCYWGSVEEQLLPFRNLYYEHTMCWIQSWVIEANLERWFLNALREAYTAVSKPNRTKPNPEKTVTRVGRCYRKRL